MMSVYIVRLFLFAFLYVVFTFAASFVGKRIPVYKFIQYNILFIITVFILTATYRDINHVISTLYLSLWVALNIYHALLSLINKWFGIFWKIFLELVIVFGLLFCVMATVAYAGDFRIKDVFSEYRPDGSCFIKPGCWLEMIESSLTLALILVGVKNTYNFYLASRMNNMQYRQLRQSQLQHELVMARLEALQAKINPHFLYNSLNSIAGLALVDGEKTRQMALALSKFFRYGMNGEQNNLTSLADELDMIKTYLDIEKIRFGERIDFSIITDERSPGVRIPRMLLQPLVENAIKHGFKGEINTISIQVKANVYNDTLTVSVFDNGIPFTENFVPGYGLKSIYDKLDLLFPGDYKIEILVNKDKQVRIQIPVCPVSGNIK